MPLLSIFPFSLPHQCEDKCETHAESECVGCHELFRCRKTSSTSNTITNSTNNCQHTLCSTSTVLHYASCRLLCGVVAE